MRSFMNNSERKRLIQKLVSDSSLDPLSRRLKIGAIISSAFKEDGFDIILTGGSAVEFYTAGNYMTGDIDFHVYADADKERIMHELGFKGQLRNYHLEDEYIEFVSTEYMGDRDRIITQFNEFGSVKIIGLEDILIDRVKGTKFSDQASPVYEEWALVLVYDNFNKLDWDYLKEQADEGFCRDTLKYLYLRACERRREVAFRQASEALGILGSDYSEEKDIDLFIHMSQNSLRLSDREIRIALKEHSPYIKSDLDAYNLQRKIDGLSPIVKENKIKKIYSKKRDFVKRYADYVPEWREIRDGYWRCDYLNGYSAIIRRLREDTFVVSFGSSDSPPNLWKDITSKRGFKAAKQWCDSRGLLIRDNVVENKSSVSEMKLFTGLSDDGIPTEFIPDAPFREKAERKKRLRKNT